MALPDVSESISSITAHQVQGALKEKYGEAVLSMFQDMFNNLLTCLHFRCNPHIISLVLA